jgi:hypothetical protein
MKETYLGDGLYAGSYDGFELYLRAPRANGEHIVFIEPTMWQDLVAFAHELWQRPDPKTNTE